MIVALALFGMAHADHHEHDHGHANSKLLGQRRKIVYHHLTLVAM